MTGSTTATLRDAATIESLARTFASGLLAVDLARPLLSLDANQKATEAMRLMRDRSCPVIGVRVEGRITGWVSPADAAQDAELSSMAKPVLPENCLDDKAGIQQVLTHLAGQQQVFLCWLGEPAAVITRNDLQKPPVRMWLFGVVTLLDANMTWAVEALHPNDAWLELISEDRRCKAISLREERHRRGSEVQLVDCLQIKDKADILTKVPERLAQLGLKSRREAERMATDVELLRNHVAHGQELEDTHLETACRLAGSLETILRADLSTKLVAHQLESQTPNQEVTPPT